MFNSFLLEASTNCSSKSVGPVVHWRSVYVVIMYDACIVLMTSVLDARLIFMATYTVVIIFMET